MLLWLVGTWSLDPNCFLEILKIICWRFIIYKWNLNLWNRDTLHDFILLIHGDSSLFPLFWPDDHSFLQLAPTVTRFLMPFATRRSNSSTGHPSDPVDPSFRCFSVRSKKQPANAPEICRENSPWVIQRLFQHNTPRYRTPVRQSPKPMMKEIPL